LRKFKLAGLIFYIFEWQFLVSLPIVRNGVQTSVLQAAWQAAQKVNYFFSFLDKAGLLSSLHTARGEILGQGSPRWCNVWYFFGITVVFQNWRSRRVTMDRARFQRKTVHVLSFPVV